MEKRGDLYNFYKYNDYELLYLIDIGNEDALETLVWKYGYLIKSKINKMNIPQVLRDDFYQEGCITLLKSAKIYDQNSKVYFTYFFDLILTRRFINLLRENKTMMVCEYRDTFDDVSDNMILKEDDYFNLDCLEFNFTEFENLVYQKIFVENKKIMDIAKELNTSSKCISNGKQRIIKKMRRKLKINNN